MQDTHSYRIISRLPKDFIIDLAKYTKSFRVAGGVFLRKYNDVDVFPVNARDFKGFKPQLGKVLSETTNAATLKYGDSIIQLCDYHKDTLEDLVESFDFSHCKIGAELQIKNADIGHLAIKRIYTSEDYIKSCVEGITFYTGSEYPISSLIRTHKVANKLGLNRVEFSNLLISVLVSVISRGFRDYDDFKDQLDAIDLSYLPEELAQLKIDDLKTLFELLEKK